jgi:hypothetical protein
MPGILRTPETNWLLKNWDKFAIIIRNTICSRYNKPGVLSQFTMEEFQIVRKDGDNYVISERSTRPPT